MEKRRLKMKSEFKICPICNKKKKILSPVKDIPCKECADFLFKKKRIEINAIIMLQNLLQAFPALDPESKFYDQPVNGADAVQWLSENAFKMRNIINEWKVRKWKEK